ncbi:aspartyl-trna synthetase [Amylibacter kogurei]|uniref:Aspartyl-trna synthetase n=1 Tax=Paramylibacter kogurei TaxID=1889778 RepID=A0A2G5K351_9RHOB|nr:aspartyl-trna synthetase [Amylibacter kogurei]
MIKNQYLGALCAVFMTSSAYAETERGPVTNLPMPRFVSMKTNEGNVRRGPSLTHRIDWVFKHEDMPLMVVGEYGHWRRVLDADGQGGWMHFRLLSGVRTVTIEKNRTPMRRKPYEGSEAVAFAEDGVIARLGECTLDWCKISAGKIRGWVKKGEIWGVGKNELRD